MTGRTAGALLAAALPAAVAAWALRRTFLLVRVVGGSMEPAYRDGTRLLVRTGRPARTGDVVIFRNPLEELTPDGMRWLVKRVAAAAGDPVPEDVGDRVGAAPGDVVPPGMVVVRGDAASTVDSRHFGYVPAETVLGVVLNRGGR